MKRFLALFLALTMVLSLSAVALAADETDAADTNGDGEIVIGFSLMDYSFEFFQAMLGSARKTAEENGVKLIELDGGSDVQKQLEGLEDMLANYDLDAIFLNPVDADAIGTFTLEANEAGVPVVTVDVRSNEGEVYAHVASSNYDIGALAAEHAVSLLEERHDGEVTGTVYCMGFPAITSMYDRAQGFTEYFEDYPDVEVVEIDVTELSVLAGQNLWDDTMTGHGEGEIDVVYGTNDQVATGIIAAAEAANRTDIDVIGTDDGSAVLEALAKNSFVAATVVQSPIDMGRLGILNCIAAAKGEEAESTEVGTELQLVTREEYEEYETKHAEDLAAIADWQD